MVQTSNDSLQKTLPLGYIPLTEFWEFVKQDTTLTYHSTFSFAKLIETQKGRNNGQSKVVSEILGQLQHIETQLREGTYDWESLSQNEEMEGLFSLVLPAFFFKDQMGFVKKPFENFAFKFQTEAFQKVLSDPRWELKIDTEDFIKPSARDILIAGALVLNRFYGQEIEFFAAEHMVIRDRETKMERHYKFEVQLEFLEVKALQPLKELSREKVHELLNNLQDEELWLRYIPPENFVFEGFILGFLRDVTKEEILSSIKEMAANETARGNFEEDLDYFEVLGRSFLQMPDLRLGVLQIEEGPWIETISWCLLRTHDEAVVRPSLEDPQSSYGEVLHTGIPQLVRDLQTESYNSPIELALKEQGVSSLLLCPLRNGEGEVVGILEFGSPEPYRFTQLTLLQLEDFIGIMEMGTNKFLQEMNNSVRLTIQQEFTSIHPSVEWKFREVASKYYWEHILEKRQSSPDPIVFKQVFPLYGQADIVGSSKKRNASIQADLVDNLERLHQVLIACKERLAFHLLDVYAKKVQNKLEGLKQSFASTDESVVVELLTLEIHPLLRKLSKRFDQLPHEQLNAYFNYLDPDLDIVYRQRKAYEDSVTLLNQTISYYLLQEEEKMQKILPHYFEKFQTDGVEYNLYLGQALLEKGEFDAFYLRDFRLWQLVVMCEITRLVERESQYFPVRLTTAQLVFVFNSSLSIRFRMDEKQFDIDGAYNVRYEILKKRIDKAYVKGTDERLTQAGKIAIVWLQEKDRQEYQEYLDYLIAKGYIKPKIEDLDLERMQGVEGLKAMRVEVIGG
ncbi:MAG: GAF domain-containing protein [Bacteroidota bacterium]